VSEHVEPGDPRYDGHRVETIWALTAIDSSDDREGVVHISTYIAVRHHLMVGPAIGSDERRADHLRDAARELSSYSRVPIRLRRFTLAETEEFYP
jgi:hypothetical protein